MDLVLIVLPLGNRHRLSMWRMGGFKVWDVEVSESESAEEQIVDLQWSPDGAHIAEVCHLCCMAQTA